MSILNRIHAAKDNDALKLIIKNQVRIWEKKTLYPVQLMGGDHHNRIVYL